MKEVINITLSDSFFFNKHNCSWIVNDKTYPANRFKLRIVKHNPQDLERENKQLKTFTDLKKKLLILNKQLKQYDTATDTDTKIIKGKAIKKTREILNRYLQQLTKDSYFNYTVNDGNYCIAYEGKYITATHKGMTPRGVF